MRSSACSGPRASRRSDRKSTRLNSSHVRISYAVFCLKKKNKHLVEQVVKGSLREDIEGRAALFLFRHFFFNDTATTEISTLSLHDALPICTGVQPRTDVSTHAWPQGLTRVPYWVYQRSEEHTSELQSRPHLVCRLLLE